MKRRFIPLNKLNIFDSMHLDNGDGTYHVLEEHDGQTTQQHIDGVNYIRGVLREGQKIRPILVYDKEDGTYQRLDGFKRARAHIEENCSYIEAYVCSLNDYLNQRRYPLGDSEIVCYHGGLPKEEYGLFEGGEDPAFDYENMKFLFKSPNHDGLRIEISDCVHVHWGAYGKYRFALGERDFLLLANAVSKIWEK